MYKFISDVHVTAEDHENELILLSVLQGFFESISLLLRGMVEKRSILENLDLVLLVLDELVDGGVILETDPGVIANRVSMRGADSETPLTEQSSPKLLLQHEQISRNLRVNYNYSICHCTFCFHCKCTKRTIKTFCNMVI